MEMLFYNFTATNGWFHSLFSRSQIRFAKLHGKSTDVGHNRCKYIMSNVLPGLTDKPYLFPKIQLDLSHATDTRRKELTEYL